MPAAVPGPVDRGPRSGGASGVRAAAAPTSRGRAVLAPLSAVGPESESGLFVPVAAPEPAVVESAEPLVVRDPVVALAADHVTLRTTPEYLTAAAAVASQNGAVTLEQLTAWLGGATRTEVRDLVKKNPGKIADIADYASATGADWKPGHFGPILAELAIGPLHGFAEHVLRGPLAKSWVLAKKTLTSGGGFGAAEELMQALIRFRSLHWNAILQITKAKIEEIAAGGLTNGFAAGSKTLTSDVDVNLKGSKTEQAVKLFNHIFAKDAGWGYEAGVVYDVNVYALDFMFATKGVTVPREADFGAISGGDMAQKTVPGQEGQRKVLVGGKAQTLAQGGLTERAFTKMDNREQDAWALVKVRMYLPQAEWDTFVGSDPAAPTAMRNYTSHIESLGSELLKLYTKDTENSTASATYKSIMKDGATKAGTSVIESLAAAFVLDANGDQLKPQDGPATPAQLENTKMRASNRLYEEKLASIAAMRERHATMIAMNNETVKKIESPTLGPHADPPLPKQRRSLNEQEAPSQEYDAIRARNSGLQNIIQTELFLKQIREEVSAAALLSNEAYITDGAVNHAVVGLQGGVALTLSRRALQAAVTENYGDALKEIAHANSDLGKAMWKASKYIWRLTDAALNLGLKNENLDRLYEAAHSLAVTLKGQTEVNPADAATAPEAALKKANDLKVDTVIALSAMLSEIATAARKLIGEGDGLATPSTKGGKSAHLSVKPTPEMSAVPTPTQS